MSSTHLDGQTFKEASVPQANLTPCARTVGISLSPKCRSQAAWRNWEDKRLKPASKACSGHAGERSGLVLPFTSQQRGTLSDAGGLGTMASPLVPAAQALEEATRPPHRRKDILRTASKPGAPRCVPQEPRSFILSRFSGAQSERASAGRFWVQLTLLGPSTVPGVDVADVLGAELARVARGGAAGRACVWCLLA